jgi:hypothetical protein
MGRTTKQMADGSKAKPKISMRAQKLLERIRLRRERIRRRVGILPNSAELIRQDRER